MEMDSTEVVTDALPCSTDLLITCNNTEVHSATQNLDLQVSLCPDTTNQQLSALTEQYHFIDQHGNSIHYEIQALPGNSQQMMILTSESENGQVFHVIPSSQSGTAQLIIPHGQIQDSPNPTEQSSDNLQPAADTAVPVNAGNLIIHTNSSLALSRSPSNRSPVDQFQKPLQPLPPNIPLWARRLRGCERIGDSYRGYCLSEAELMSVLGLHKQQTQSVWGTRQSPSPAKPSARLMWKSQYVPYDGIPFVNAGSRAIVMECQYGPRRKGIQPKKTGENESTSSQKYKATCPARIYIKKVKKFPNYRVPTDPKIDKKLIRMEQEKAFNLLKKDMKETEGVLRWYVQLPDQDAHEYHHLETGCFSPSPNSFQNPAEEEEDFLCEENSVQPSRLHSRVAEKIRELVASGIYEVYSVRKQLRKFVERELFKPDDIPERHNLSYFPTVVDLKNHIHEAQKSLGNEELIYDAEGNPGTLQWATENENVLNEMVTVTFESPVEEGNNSFSTPEWQSDLSLDQQAVKAKQSLNKVENLTTEHTGTDTTQLISSLTSIQPKIFAQLQGLQLQPQFASADGTPALITVNQPASTFTSPEGTTALIAVNQPASSFTTPEGTTALITVNPPALGSGCLLNPGGSSQPVVFSHMQSQPDEDSPVSSVTTLPSPGHNLVSMGQLVRVEDATAVAGEVHQILLGEMHPIPITIVETQPSIVDVNSANAFFTKHIEEVKEETLEEQLSAIEEQTTECQDPA
ncbi:calcium-responsive transcription factor isoform X1 [Pelobates fuscus]|uniref:calcium-responsive transcription factor isoform X1 n=1 Tax=Pelobates fuscus TaxID=191477 RepID=UPI002FE442EE